MSGWSIILKDHHQIVFNSEFFETRSSWSFVFLTEDKHNKNPLKTLESLGKELISGLLDDFVEKNVLKLEEEEKKKIYDAKLQDKARVLVDSIRQKNQEAGQVFVQTFLNIDKNSTNIKGKTGILYKGFINFFRIYFALRLFHCLL